MHRLLPLIVLAAALHAAEPLRGLNVGNLAETTLQDAAAMGANLVRVFVPPAPPRRDAFLKGLPAALDRAAALGITVAMTLPPIPDLGRRPYPDDRKQQLAVFWDDPASKDRMLDDWRAIIAHCVGRKQAIWYDLLNEPLDWRDFPKAPHRWQGWAQELAVAVRALDPDPAHAIVIEPGPGGLCWGFKEFLPITGVPGIIYSTHMYEPHEYTHQGVKQLRNTDLAKAYEAIGRPWPGPSTTAYAHGIVDRDSLRTALEPARRFQEENGVRIWMGEFSAARWAPGAETYIGDIIAIAEEWGWDWTYHSFRASDIWSLEHDESLSAEHQGAKATGTTRRAAVVLAGLERNRTPPAPPASPAATHAEPDPPRP